jgi:putative PIN family toxin of toxin-antitoxin system
MLSWCVKITLDTNVLYQALRNAAGTSHAILQLVRHGEIQLALSVPVFQEYEAVLTRKETLEQCGLTASDMKRVLDFIAFAGHPVSVHYLLRPNLQDEADNMFVELAFASKSLYLITSNMKDYRKAELKFDSFVTILPAEFMKRWRDRYG